MLPVDGITGWVAVVRHVCQPSVVLTMLANYGSIQTLLTPTQMPLP